MESIYNLLPVEPAVLPKSKRHDKKYQSIYRPMAKKGMAEHKIGRSKTIGPAAIQRPNPSLFLRSHTCLNVHRNADSNDQENICPGKKPPLPNFRQKLEIKDSNELNIINLNKLLAILSEPKKHESIIVDSKIGHMYNLNGSGLTKDHLYKKFGKIPAYLKRRMDEKLKNAELYTCYNEEVALHQQFPRLSPQERENLLKLLKQKHSQVYSEFLRLSVIIDTLHKRLKKERLEKALNELEKDIRTIEEHEFIYVKE
ncbi:Enkurin [Taenia solium]